MTPALYTSAERGSNVCPANTSGAMYLQSQEINNFSKTAGVYMMVPTAPCCTTAPDLARTPDKAVEVATPAPPAPAPGSDLVLVSTDAEVAETEVSERGGAEERPDCSI